MLNGYLINIKIHHLLVLPIHHGYLILVSYFANNLCEISWIWKEKQHHEVYFLETLLKY